jgi:hypothetical protein
MNERRREKSNKRLKRFIGNEKQCERRKDGMGLWETNLLRYCIVYTILLINQ